MYYSGLQKRVHALKILYAYSLQIISKLKQARVRARPRSVDVVEFKVTVFEDCKFCCKDDYLCGHGVKSRSSKYSYLVNTHLGTGEFSFLEGDTDLLICS